MPTGSVWRFHDLGQDLGTNWRSFDYDDQAWSAGRGPLGYGDANGLLPVTTNSYGPNASAKFITTYYRRSFTVTQAAWWTNLVVNLQRDDGAIVYLNGVEVFRSNMPTGLVTALTNASSNVNGAAESAWYSQAADASLLREGTNVLAAEVHQSGGSSSDLFFDLELSANQRLVPPALLATGNPAQLRVAWPAWAGGLSLWFTTNLQPPRLWTALTNASVTTNGSVMVTVPIESRGRFFQLRAW
jgi:hypothetical protein